MGKLRITDPGLKTFVEDLGRFGYQRYGVSVSGAMDEYAARIANFLVGNGPDAAVLEITLKGVSLEFRDDALFAITGGECDYTLNGKPVALWQSHCAKAGDKLAGGFCVGGLRDYIGIAGGIDVPEVMGSRSTNLRGKFGGFQGRALLAGDVLDFGAVDSAKLPPERYLKNEYIPHFTDETEFRVIMGPQDDAFTEAGKQTFLGSPYKVGYDSDRMGIRLAGEKIEHVKAADIISDGIAMGSVQVPGDGQPIVITAERQSTGGYTKIATVISADRSKMAQARPKGIIRFRAVSLEEGIEALRASRAFLENLEQYCPVK
ncbi:urea carboxylase [Spirochaetia bacterium]|nr:urea carboxylase [Spirochaetia bacterium]